MSKSRMLLAAAVAALAVMLIGGAGPAAAQTSAPASVPASQVVKMTGTAKNGKKFKGTLTIQRFTTRGGKLVAHGLLKGRLKGKQVKRIVNVPVSTSSTPGSGAQAAQANTCAILHLVLGPLDLHLLGLNVHLNTVVLDVTGTRGPGNLLGNLLCALTGLLDQNALQGPLSQLTAALNSVLAALPRLP
jgi:hypothetical protein